MSIAGVHPDYMFVLIMRPDYIDKKFIDKKY